MIFPYVTKCEEYKREWIHPEKLRFYLYYDETLKKWCVIDRFFDLSCGKYYTRKKDCINAFIKKNRKEDLGL